MRKLSFLVFLMLGLVLGASQAIAQQTSNSMNNSQDQSGYLFIQQAEDAELSVDNSATSSSSNSSTNTNPSTSTSTSTSTTTTGMSTIYKLTLKDVPSYVIYLTNKPEDKVGLLPINTFYQKLGSSSNIKVELHYLKNNQDMSIALTLSDPQYDSNNDEVTYKATLANPTDKVSTSDEYEGVVLFFSGMSE